MDRSGVDVNKEKAAPSSKRLREEYNSEKLTKDLKASSSSKSDRKRKSNGADSDRKGGSSQKKSRQDPKTKSRPPKKPDAMALLHMQEMGIPTNSHTSDRISNSKSSSSDSSKTKSISSKKEYPPDPDYKTWKLDEKELRIGFILIFLADFEKFCYNIIKPITGGI